MKEIKNNNNEGETQFKNYFFINKISNNLSNKAFQNFHGNNLKFKFKLLALGMNTQVAVLQKRKYTILPTAK